MPRPAQKADANSVRKWNEYLVVSSLREHGAQRISELGHTTGLTPAPLGYVIRRLEAKGWVKGGQSVRTGLGRPAQVYSLHVPDGSVLGLDVGAHMTRAVLTDFAGRVLHREETPVLGSGVDDQRAAIVTALSDIDSGPDVWLTTIAIGGQIDVTKRVVRSVAFPAFEGHHPQALFRDVLPSSAIVVNDVRASVLAEQAVGAARGHDDVLLAHLGRRPTLGVLLDGRPRPGAHGTAGDMSLSPLLPSEDAMDWVAPYSHLPDPFGEAVAAAKAGDPQALTALDRYIHSIAPALAFATSVVDPSIFVVAGGLTPVAHLILPILERELSLHVQQPPPVFASELDQFAAALGAALVALGSIHSTLASSDGGVLPFTKEELGSHVPLDEPFVTPPPVRFPDKPKST